MFTLTIKTDNAAFHDTDPSDECARILREVAKRMMDGSYHGSIFDSNGNTVGSFKLT